MLLLVFIHILGLLSAALTNLGADLTGILSYLSSEQREFIIFLLPYSFCLHQIVQVQPVKERITKLPDCRGWLIADASLLLIPFPPLPPPPHTGCLRRSRATAGRMNAGLCCIMHSAQW